jgi:hypothetical protein
MESSEGPVTESMACSGQWYSLPFVDQSIQMDEDGARFVAWLACRMAIDNSGALETDKTYALRMASFIVGYMASGRGSDVRRIRIFHEFLPRVTEYLHGVCSSCHDEKSREEAIDALVDL